MKRHDFAERRLRRMAEEIEEAIDCTQCANCCRVATTRLLERDVDKLAKFLGIKPQRFVEQYCGESEEEGLILRRTERGCIFLEGTLCLVYEARPSTCDDFPHLVRGGGSLVSRMWQMIDRACYCPIVYNAIEAFKPEVGFRR
jgi:Fe-S-cluster containining protein